MHISKKFLAITAILTLIGFVTQGILGGGLAFLRGVGDIIILAFALTLISRLFRSRSTPWRIYFFRSSLILGAVIGFFASFLWIFAFLSNSFPGALSKIVLSNGERTIIYYQMSHIATEKYYSEIQKEVETLANQGYQIYIEGVLPGTPENQDRLERAIGVKISSGTYADVARIMGMESQDDTLYEGITPERISHVDLSVDDIVSTFSTGSLSLKEPVDISQELQSIPLTVIGQKAVSYILRSVMNFSIRYSLSGDRLLDVVDYETAISLLDRRNHIVIDTYVKNNHEKSVFLYGALHFDGMYNYLKSLDTKWEIQSLEPIYPYVP